MRCAQTYWDERITRPNRINTTPGINGRANPAIPKQMMIQPLTVNPTFFIALPTHILPVRCNRLAKAQQLWNFDCQLGEPHANSRATDANDRTSSRPACLDANFSFAAQSNLQEAQHGG